MNDGKTPASQLVVTAISSNTGLIPDGNIQLGGSGTDRTIQVTPLFNQIGITTITVTVRDAQNYTSSDSFVVRVVDPATVPTISAISDVTILEDGTTGPIPFTLADADTPVTSLTITAGSSNLAIIPTSNVLISGTVPIGR